MQYHQIKRTEGRVITTTDGLTFEIENEAALAKAAAARFISLASINSTAWCWLIARIIRAASRL